MLHLVLHALTGCHGQRSWTQPFRLEFLVAALMLHLLPCVKLSGHSTQFYRQWSQVGCAQWQYKTAGLSLPWPQNTPSCPAHQECVLELSSESLTSLTEEYKSSASKLQLLVLFYSPPKTQGRRALLGPDPVPVTLLFA